MTNQQKDLFIGVAQMGVCCGLYKLQEWFDNYMMHTMNMFKYEDIPQKEAEVINAFAQFIRESDDINPNLSDEQVLELYFNNFESK